MKYLILLFALIQSKPSSNTAEVEQFGNEATNFLCTLSSKVQSSGYWIHNQRFTLIYFDEKSRYRCVISIPYKDATGLQLPSMSALCDKDAQPVCFLEGNVAMQWRAEKEWTMKADLYCHDKRNVQVHLNLASNKPKQ